MKLLRFRMPPFARVMWVSKQAKETWEPKIQVAASTYTQLERLTVIEGLRQCMTTHFYPETLGDGMRALARDGLVFLPLVRVGSYQGFAHSHPPVIEGRPWSYYGVCARSLADAEAFAHATEKSDHATMGRLLGFPPCCIEFFNTVWLSGYIDPVWHAAVRCQCEHVKEQSPTHIRLNASVPHEIFPGLRYIGIRLISHLPCALDCHPSQKIASNWKAVGQKAGLEGITVLEEILHWPVEWDCLKGIALVSTPAFRIATNSIPCYPRYVVQKEGTRYPDGVPRGLKFPWHPPAGAIPVRDISFEAERVGNLLGLSKT